MIASCEYGNCHERCSRDINSLCILRIAFEENKKWHGDRHSDTFSKEIILGYVTYSEHNGKQHLPLLTGVAEEGGAAHCSEKMWLRGEVNVFLENLRGEKKRIKWPICFWEYDSPHIWLLFVTFYKWIQLPSVRTPQFKRGQSDCIIDVWGKCLRSALRKDFGLVVNQLES